MDRLQESFFIDKKSKEIYSRTIWCRKYIKLLNSEETEKIIFNDSPELFVNYERDCLTCIAESEIKSLWETDLKNHISEDYSYNLQQFTRGYCYVAELWQAKHGQKVLVLKYFH